MKRIILVLLISIMMLTGCNNIISKDLIETVKSPNGNYEIKTYLHNCGATCQYSLSAELCNTKNKCEEIYYSYGEATSFCYWIDDENVFINQKILNIYDDKYDNIDNRNAFKLYNGECGQRIYLIDKSNYVYELSEYDVYYINKVATSLFDFNKKNSYSEYNFIMKVDDIYTKSTKSFYLTIEKNKMYLINDNKMSELNRTDYEYMKKIMASNDLYKFNWGNDYEEEYY